MFVIGVPRLLLRLESILILLISLHFFDKLGGDWLLFALLFLVPDVSLLGYLKGSSLGAKLYNGAHTYISAALCAAIGMVVDQPILYDIALIWTAHIAIDRVLGLGLKYASGFKLTHLGSIGSDSSTLPEELVGQ